MTRSLIAFLVSGLVLGAPALHSQTKLQDQLSRIDLGVAAVGEYSGSVSGVSPTLNTDQGQLITIDPSTTVGALVTIRYSARPYIGAEVNGGYSRYNETLNVLPTNVQTQVDEFTFGYLVLPPYRIFGVKPYASAGIGGLRFGPTRGGGQGALAMGRFAAYYSLGLQKDLISDNFGVRVGFRQLFYEAPDFQQNYLILNKRTATSEPQIGFYLRF